MKKRRKARLKMLKVRILKEHGSVSAGEARDALEMFLTARLVAPGIRFEVAAWSNDGGTSWTFAENGESAAVDFWPLLRTIDPGSIRLAGVDENAD